MNIEDRKSVRSTLTDGRINIVSKRSITDQIDLINTTNNVSPDFKMNSVRFSKYKSPATSYFLPLFSRWLKLTSNYSVWLGKN